MTAPRTSSGEIRYVARGLDASGSAHWELSDGEKFFTTKDLDGLDAHDPRTLERVWAQRTSPNLQEAPPPARYLPPLPVRRIFCPAVNFRAHSQESGMQERKEPYFFLKFPSSAVGHGSTVELPRQATRVDYEGEIGVVIGTGGKHWTVDEAEKAIFGYTIVNDLSLRDYQFREEPRYGKNWVMGKAFDGSLPMGPWILPRELLPEFDLTIQTRVNGEVRQDGTTRDMIFSNAELISYLSEVNTMGPGDLVATGTPAGVAAHQGQRYLKDGDRVEVEVRSIGTLSHSVAYERSP